MKTKLTDEEKTYNRALGAFKFRVTTMLKYKGVRPVQFQLDHIMEADKTKLFYKDVTKDDAIQILKDKIDRHIIEYGLV